MAQHFTARAVVVGDRRGSVVPDAVVDMEDGEIRWVGPASEAPEPGTPRSWSCPGSSPPAW